MRARISVIMASYNHAPYVTQAVQSVLSQSFADFEFLIADDGSTDGSAQLLRGFSDERIRLFLHEENRGASVVLNELLDVCKGEFVALINSDDMFEPDKLQTQLLFMQMHKSTAATFTWVSFIDGDSDPIEGNTLFDQPDRSRTQWLKQLFYGNCLCHPTIMARRRMYRLRFDERLCKLPDYDMWIRLLKRYEIAILPQRLTRFRLHDSNESAPNAQTLTLITHETPLTLAHYATLSRHDCAAVFGQTGGRGARVAAAYCAALALGKSAQAWGIQGLYALSASRHKGKARAASLQSIAAKSDSFCVCAVAILYFALPEERGKNPFCEQNSLKMPLAQGKFTLEFTIYQTVTQLRFDPDAHPCRMHITRFEAHTAQGQTLDLIPCTLHNGQAEQDFVVFTHFDPSFVCHLDIPTELCNVSIAGEWDISDVLPLLPVGPTINYLKH